MDIIFLIILSCFVINKKKILLAHFPQYSRLIIYLKKWKIAWKYSKSFTRFERVAPQVASKYWSTDMGYCLILSLTFWQNWKENFSPMLNNIVIGTLLPILWLNIVFEKYCFFYWTNVGVLTLFQHSDSIG